MTTDTLSKLREAWERAWANKGRFGLPHDMKNAEAVSALLAELERERERMREALEDLAMERALIWRRDMTDAERAQGWADHVGKMNDTARRALNPEPPHA